jgi:hypothetical protein
VCQKLLFAKMKGVWTMSKKKKKKKESKNTFVVFCLDYVSTKQQDARLLDNEIFIKGRADFMLL